MKKFNCTLEAKVDVAFSSPEKAEAFFIESDWKESFFQLDTLDEVAEHLSYAFFVVHREWSTKYKCFYKFVEGFGDFFLQKNGTYKGGASDGEAGEIIIETDEDLEVSWCTEI